jgi:hypothetical protein
MSKLIRAVQHSKSLADLNPEREKGQRTPPAQLRRDKRQREASALLQQVWARRA